MPEYFGLPFLDLLKWSFAAATACWVLTALVFTRMYFLLVVDGRGLRDPFVLSNTFQGLTNLAASSFYTYAIWFERSNAELLRTALLGIPTGMIMSALIHSVVAWFAAGRRWR